MKLVNEKNNIGRLEDFNLTIYKRYDRKIKDFPVRSFAKHNLKIIKTLKEDYVNFLNRYSNLQKLYVQALILLRKEKEKNDNNV